MGNIITPVKGVSVLDTLTFYKLFNKWVAQFIIK